MIVKSKIMV